MSDAELDDGGEAILEDIGLDERGLWLRARHPGVANLTESLVQWFIECGGENYVEMSVYHEKTGHLVLTLQRREGKTPGQVVQELKARIAELEAVQP